MHHTPQIRGTGTASSAGTCAQWKDEKWANYHVLSPFPFDGDRSPYFVRTPLSFKYVNIDSRILAPWFCSLLHSGKYVQCGVLASPKIEVTF